MTDEQIGAWLEWMRLPVDQDFIWKVLETKYALGPSENDEPLCERQGYERLCKSVHKHEDDYDDDDFVEWELDEIRVKAADAPTALAFLRRQPPSGNVVLPRLEESLWMSQRERELVEWFDRREYAVFMRLCSQFDFNDGWIVPACFSYCCMFGKGGLAHDPHRHYCFFTNELMGKIRASADSGNARALNFLGILSKNGCRELNIRQDPCAARDYFRRSAEGGCTPGKLNYAKALSSGLGGELDLDQAEKIYKAFADQGVGVANFKLAGLAFYRRAISGAFDVGAFVANLRLAAEHGEENATAIIAAAKGDLSPERLVVEYILHNRTIESKGTWFPQQEEDSFSVCLRDEFTADDKKAAKDRAWVASQQPAGAIVPPAGGRETVRTPNLTSANPSFAAQLVKFVRDRFGGDAPAVYNSAHISRKTYSSIISNELRPISKQTAMSLALGLRLTFAEAERFIKAAGFAFSMFMLEDIIVEACIRAGIYDISRVNEILAAHGAKTFPAAESDHQFEEQK